MVSHISIYLIFNYLSSNHLVFAHLCTHIFVLCLQGLINCISNNSNLVVKIHFSFNKHYTLVKKVGSLVDEHSKCDFGETSLFFYLCIIEHIR